jgi:hypothetical protein
MTDELPCHHPVSAGSGRVLNWRSFDKTARALMSGEQTMKFRMNLRIISARLVKKRGPFRRCQFQGIMKQILEPVPAISVHDKALADST